MKAVEQERTDYLAILQAGSVFEHEGSTHTLKNIQGKYKTGHMIVRTEEGQTLSVHAMVRVRVLSTPEDE